MSEFKQEYRRKLPHIQPENAVFFVTFCLYATLPKHIVAELSQNVADTKQNLLINSQTKNNAVYEYNENIEGLLHSGQFGEHWLKQSKVAKVVADSFHFLDNNEFKLVCFCIMSNHVHFIAYNCKKPLNKIMHSLKSFTANQCNKVLGRSGAFWQREYFDRVVRDRNDLARKIEYVINNPVNAGIVDSWTDYKYTYCKSGFSE